MSSGNEWKKLVKPKRFSLLFASVVAVLSVLSAAVSTFAWFQAEARVQIQTSDPATATISVSKPEEAKFYYFKGNGNPASLDTYVGYSASDANVGTTTNIVDTANGTIKANSQISSAAEINFASHFQEITGEGNFTAAKCFDWSRIRPGCYFTYAVSYQTAAAMTLKMGQFTQSVEGSSLTPKRYLGASGTTSLSLAQTLNSTSYSVAYSTANDLNTSATDYIKKTLGVGSLAITGDGIDFDGTTPSTTANNHDFTLASKASGSNATYYIFYTVYMESDKTNALRCSSSTSSVRNYVKDSTNGSYAPYDGLSVTVSSISLT